ncbi:MAG: AAA family ATPase [Chlamydiota bacterium]
MFKRLVDWHLKKWKDNIHRKPLLIRGARQTGKTYAVRKLGKHFDNMIEVNFELAKDARPIFEKDLKPERILRDLSLHFDKEIKPGNTLLFFDEIQEAPQAILALRYFYELMPSLHVIAAGSLFDFALEKVGLPVGRVSSIHLYPLSFVEFLAAGGHNLILKAILDNSQKIPFSESVHAKIMNLVGEYLAIGGMPEAVAKWISSRNAKESFQVHHDLISSYRQDFEKYAEKHQLIYMEALFNQIPPMIGEQFQYKNIHGNYRKRELSPCLDLLCKANVIHKIHHSAGNGIPLGAEINPEWFKIIFVDVALCQATLGFDLSTWFLQPGIEFVNRGAITEAFVGQELLCYAHPYRKTDLYYWRRVAKSSTAELDFLYEYNREIIPIEVKSGHGGKLKSMNLFLAEHQKSPYGIRFSAQNYSVFEKIDSRPLYDVVSLAHEDQRESLKELL